MRCLPYLASLVLLGGAMTSCQSDMQAPALAQPQENGFDLLLQDAKARIAAEMRMSSIKRMPKLSMRRVRFTSLRATRNMLNMPAS